MFGIGFLVGLIVGANVGIVLFAILYTAGRSDKNLNVFDDSL